MNSKIDCEQPGIYRAAERIVTLTSKDITCLAQPERWSALNRARICTHRSNEATVHEMFICVPPNSYVRPHKHLESFESMHVVRGSAKLLVFSEEGDVTAVINVGPFDEGAVFFYRMPPNTFHAVVSQDDGFIFHEVVEGPFNPHKTLSAPWSPAESEIEGGLAFLRAKMGAFVG